MNALKPRQATSGACSLKTLASTSTSPIPAERDQAVDALRGYALFGIILVNVPFFASPIYEGPPMKGAVDGWAFGALTALAIGKFFLIFSFLFGFGFATALAADQRNGRASGPRFARRLIALLAFGMLHAVFLFIGDILMLYAMLGVILWLVRDLRPRTLLISSGLIYLVAVVAQVAALTASGFDGDGVLARATAAYLGGFWDAVRFRLSEDLWIGQPFIIVFNGPAALSMFMAGLALARSGTFPGRAGQRLGATWGWSLLLVGLAVSFANLAWVGPDYVMPATGGTVSAFLAATARSAAAPLLSAGYGILLMNAVDRSPESLWARLLANTGKMALTGYLLHSVILAFIFGGWGLGLFGKVGAAHCVVIGSVVYLALVALFAAWRRIFRYGPDVWLLRSFIDLEIKPLRR